MDWTIVFGRASQGNLLTRPGQLAGVRSGFQLGVSDDYHESHAPPRRRTPVDDALEAQRSPGGGPRAGPDMGTREVPPEKVQ